MNPLRRLGWLLFLPLVPALPAQAASGSIDSFGASATRVQVGGTVDFTVQYSILTSSTRFGGSDPIEPAPQEGYQEWFANWSTYELETLRSVWLQGGGQGFNDLPSVGPGSSHSGSWSFSVTFAQAGTFDIGVAGGWQVEVESGFSNETASRNCYVPDPLAPGDLFCDSWDWRYADADDRYTSDGSFGASGLQIEVFEATTAVPEPGTGLLWLGGAGWLAWRARRRR